MAQLSLRGVKKRFKDLEVLHGIDLDIGDKEFVVFVGPSGCGKSTLLRLIAGLDPMSDGDLVLNGRSLKNVAPSKRDMAMVFQSYALYPHMDVYENMAFGARLMGLTPTEVETRINEAARMLKLDALLKRKPRELSGGQRQRVAIGRALVRKPELFLLDEPLSNLDAALRSDVRLEIAKLHRDIGATMIYVTHDQVEAMTLANRIVVMNLGRIEQVGTPRELYETPANTFVATFIGSPKMTLIEVARDGDRLAIQDGGSFTLANMPAADGKAMYLGVRPDGLKLMRGKEPEGFSARVTYAEYLGDNVFVYAQLANGQQVVVRAAPGESYAADDIVTIVPAPQAAHFFSVETGKRLVA